MNTGGQETIKEKTSVLTPGRNRLFAVIVPHAQNLYHTDEDVDEVQLKANALVDNVTLDVAALSQTSMVQDLLDVIEGEATEDSKTTVQPDALGPHQSTGRSGGENHRSKTRQSDEGNTSEKRATEVQVLLLLGSGTDEGNGAHQAKGVDTSASEQSRVVEHERR